MTECKIFCSAYIKNVFSQVLIMIKISGSHLLMHWNTSKVLLQSWRIFYFKKRSKKPYFPCQNWRCMVLQWTYLLLPNARGRWKLYVTTLEFLVHSTLVIFSLLELNLYFLRNNCPFCASNLQGFLYLFNGLYVFPKISLFGLPLIFNNQKFILQCYT